MQEKSLAGELLDFDNSSLQGITSSAMIQARYRLKLSAFEHVFHASHVNSYEASQYQGYRLLAQDGSDINLRKAALNNHAASLLHLNTFYDLLSQSYIAVNFQTKKQTDERQNLCNIVDATSFTLPTIIIADRGYESYNVFAHIMHAGQKFLIRAKRSQ